MAKIKISENLFLGVNELNHLVKFLEDDGYKRIVKQIVKKYGIVQNSDNSNFVVSKVDNDSVTISSGLAIDGNVNIISLKESKTLELQNNVEHYICIRYSETHVEEGVVNISRNGVLSGFGTKFLEVLRGQPNFPTKIKFYNSEDNTQEYEVVNVTNNNTATLVGDFVPEEDLKYSVVGTFTPGAVIDADNKEIYVYDDCEVFVIDGDGISTPDLNDNEYFVAKITYNEGTLYVSDIRYLNIFNSEGVQTNSVTFVNLVNLYPKMFNQFNSPSGVITTAGVELLMEFAYRIDSFTLSGDTITINSGTSNRYASIGDVPDSAFNGCILINKTNNTKALISDFSSGTCTLLDSSLQLTQNDELYIIPNADEIEFMVTNNSECEENYEYPKYFKVRVDNFYCRLFLISNLDDNTQFTNPEITINYRLIKDNVSTLFTEISSCNYYDGINSENRLYSSDGIIIDVYSLNN